MKKIWLIYLFTSYFKFKKQQGLFHKMYLFIYTDGVSNQNQLNTITVVTATAATVFGVLLLIILMVAFQRRRLLKRIRRARQCAEVVEDDNDAIMSGVHFILPSYDEALRSKPTTAPPTFDEAMQTAERTNG